MRNLGKIFAVLLVSIILQLSGAWLNTFTMHHNDGRMPVFNYGADPISPFDLRHVTMTDDSHWKILCDYIPLPIFYKWGYALAITSIGDVLIYLGQPLFYLAYFMPFRFLYCFLFKRREVLRDVYGEEGFV